MIKEDIDLSILKKYGFKLLPIIDLVFTPQKMVWCLLSENFDYQTFDEKTFESETEMYFDEKRIIRYCKYPECRNEDTISNKIIELAIAGILVPQCQNNGIQ